MVNILCILLFGVLTLYIKQVTPLSIPQRNATFWRKDIQLNKEYEKSIQSEDLDEVKSLCDPARAQTDWTLYLLVERGGSLTGSL